MFTKRCTIAFIVYLPEYIAQTNNEGAVHFQSGMLHNNKKEQGIDRCHNQEGPHGHPLE